MKLRQEQKQLYNSVRHEKNPHNLSNLIILLLLKKPLKTMKMTKNDLEMTLNDLEIKNNYTTVYVMEKPLKTVL